MIHPNDTNCAPDETVVAALLLSGDLVAEVTRTFVDLGLSTPDVADLLRSSRRFRFDVAAVDAAYRADSAAFVSDVETFVALSQAGPVE